MRSRKSAGRCLRTFVDPMTQATDTEATTDTSSKTTETDLEERRLRERATPFRGGLHQAVTGHITRGYRGSLGGEVPEEKGAVG